MAEELDITISTQGDTGTASQITVESGLLEQANKPLIVRARICNADTFDNSTNATIAPASNAGATLKSHTTDKDIEIKSPDAVQATGTLTISGVVIDAQKAVIGSHTYEFDTDGVTTQGNRIVDISGDATASQGTLTVDEQPSVDDTFTLASVTYTFKAAQSIITEIAIGATVAVTQANIVARINGTDQFTGQKHATVSAAAFATNASVITARKPGTAGDSIDSTETFTDVATAQIETVTCVADVADSLDATFFQLADASGTVGIWIDTDNSGTTIPGGASALDRAIEVTDVVTGDTATAVGAAVASAINADGSYGATADTGVVTITHAATGVRTAGVDGNAGFAHAVSTVGRAVGNNAFDATTLGTTTAGVDCVASDAVTALAAAITANAVSEVTGTDGAGDTVVITAIAAGTEGNTLVSTETMTNGAFGAATLSGGIDSTPGKVVFAITDATAESIVLRIGSPEFGESETDFKNASIDITHTA